MTETLTGTNRSAGISYAELLDQDTHPVTDALREESPMPPGGTKVPAHIYYSKEFHDLEVEMLWKRVWQLACHEDEIKEVGDYHVYDIAHLSFLIVRTGPDPDDIKAYRNSCLHRGRQLREESGAGAKSLRCAFHGWCWNLDGSLREVPCQWDFPHVEPEGYSLPEAQVARWGGLVFINPDRDAAPLEDHLDDLARHFELLPYDQRYKAVHVAKIMRCNWKACQEAFMEAYHVVATHPTLMPTLGDANTRYDVWDTYSRACSPNSTPSPHLDGRSYEPAPDAKMFGRFRHPMSGFVYERAGENRVKVIDGEGAVSVFDADGRWIEGPLKQADPHLCVWVGGPMLPGTEDDPAIVHDPPDGVSLRAYVAQTLRDRFAPQVPDDCDLEQVADAELVDAIYFSVFPNWHPWGSFNTINYRFRPNGDNPDECIMDVMLFVPSPGGAENRPPPAEVHWLGPDDDWTEARQLDRLAKVFQQDSLNLPKVQKGLKNLEGQMVTFADYNESKPRHFHQLLNEWLAVP